MKLDQHESQKYNCERFNLEVGIRGQACFQSDRYMYIYIYIFKIHICTLMYIHLYTYTEMMLANIQ